MSSWIFLSKKASNLGLLYLYPGISLSFYFCEFQRTAADVDVLTHEAGHAFQAFQSRWIKEPEILFPNFESCEIHSMSMEFIAWPWMDAFLKRKLQSTSSPIWLAVYYFYLTAC